MCRIAEHLDKVIMFTSLELGRDEKELTQGGLSLRKNPLLVSIIDGCETLKALVEKQQLKPEDVASAKALIMLRTDKARLPHSCPLLRWRGQRLVLLRSCCGCLRSLLSSAPPTNLALLDTQIGFGISVTQGYGLIVMRKANSPSGWSAPLPLKVDGFSMGAVMGYSEQKTVVVLGSDEEVAVFLKVAIVNVHGPLLLQLRRQRMQACMRAAVKPESISGMHAMPTSQPANMHACNTTNARTNRTSGR